MAQTNRPLSPHAGIYRWQISNTLSILHRLTGIWLSIGAILLGTWLLALAQGPKTYGWLHSLLASWFGLVLAAGWSFCFFYHLGNGIRHLVWDAGYGFEKRTARASGIAVVTFAAVMTSGFWLLAWSGAGTAP
jgi:succinate dehydrogenase / fumarate reductase cytochrome b subunit